MLNAPMSPTRSPIATASAGYEPPRPTQSTVASSSRSGATKAGARFFAPAVRERRNTVACRVRMRSAERSRAISRSVELSSAIGSALGMAGLRLLSTSAIIGVTGPPRVSMHSITAPTCSGDGAPCGSAMASATGWISAMAAGASAQRVSAIGKAPALRSTSIKSAAEFSATTTMGLSSAMTTSRCAGVRRYLRRGLLTARQQNPIVRGAMRLLRRPAENDVSWRLRLAPPGFGKITIERGRRRSADRGPTRDPLGRKIKQRDDVETGDEHAIERAHCGDEIAAVLRFQERGDHRIDGRTLDAHVIARAGLVGGGRPPIEGLLVAGRQRLVPAVLDHVEIVAEAPAFVLNRVDHTHAGRNPRALEALREQQRKPLLVSRGHQDLECQWPAALAFDQFGAAQLVAGGCEQVERALERHAVAAGAVADRRRPGAVEHVGANGLGERRKQRFLPLIGRPAVGRQFRVIEIARAAPVEIEEVAVIDPFEVEQQ